ncbi:MAG: MBL fold metallo-hydrolase, partial [Cytophagaceae bacterium]
MHLLNKNLKVIKPGWQGNPVDKQGRFINLLHPFEPNLWDVLKWTFTRNPQREEKKNDPFKVAVHKGTDFLKSTDDCMVWLGHATFFIRINGIQILTDPVFFNVPFVKRLASWTENPEVFRNVDYILLSHDHMDHCQKSS